MRFPKLSHGMKSALALLQFALGIGLFLCAVMPAYPHGGGLDGYGCHNNRKAGGYHCHRGPLAGQSFSSKEEMVKKLSAENTDRKVQTDVKK
jgi:hypothetical protein